jgi:hypothetical protein
MSEIHLVRSMGDDEVNELFYRPRALAREDVMRLVGAIRGLQIKVAQLQGDPTMPGVQLQEWRGRALIAEHRIGELEEENEALRGEVALLRGEIPRVEHGPLCPCSECVSHYGPIH